MSAIARLEAVWEPDKARALRPAGDLLRVAVPPNALPDAAAGLIARGWDLVGLFGDRDGEGPGGDRLGDDLAVRYVWVAQDAPWLVLDVDAAAAVPSIVSEAFGADWPEREAEDLFGVAFGGHPRLGDFVLHDEDWGEGLMPMRAGFEERLARARPAGESYLPTRILDASGGFLMPVGPVFSGEQEAMQVLVETVGEEIIHAHVRLFYKFRAVERTMQGRPPEDALLLAERVNGTQAFAHALAFCRAVEALAAVEVSPRAEALRAVVAEHERVRAHVRALSGLVESTGLAVPRTLLDACQEGLLRAAGVLAGHRYLFGLCRPGGLRVDLTDAAVVDFARATRTEADRAAAICEGLAADSTFLDRLEAVGVLTAAGARALGLVGPIARAAALDGDLRRVTPYGAYRRAPVAAVLESEGDCSARFRVWRREMEASATLVSALAPALPAGPALVPVEATAGTAVGGVEAPSGRLVYWLELGADGLVARCHIMTPGLANYHALSDALRDFSFQDLPIILASLGLSVADADR